MIIKLIRRNAPLTVISAVLLMAAADLLGRVLPEDGPAGDIAAFIAAPWVWFTGGVQ